MFNSKTQSFKKQASRISAGVNVVISKANIGRKIGAFLEK
jgi:hypothetical protein